MKGRSKEQRRREMAVLKELKLLHELIVRDELIREFLHHWDHGIPVTEAVNKLREVVK